jgi:uncharacterized protein
MMNETFVANGINTGLLLAGIWLIWRLVVYPAIQSKRAPCRLEEWPGSTSDFPLFLSLVVVGALVAGLAGNLVIGWRPMSAGGRDIVATGAQQLGVLGGMAAFYLGFAPHSRSPTLRPLSGPWSGVATFLVAMPVITGASIAWEASLKKLRLPDVPQQSVDLLMTSHSNVIRAGVFILAILGAPVAEELFFRAGLFRYLRTRIPRWLALTGPALLFGVLHVDWGHMVGLGTLLPLTVLAIILSVAYERTGSIGTPIVAHILFNLYSALLALAGANG